MGIEKLKITQEKSEFTFTPHLNHVCQGIRDPAALGLWCYLTTLPPDWEVERDQLAKQFRVGRDRLNRLLKYLENNGLIEIINTSRPGRFGINEIMVKCGYDFKNEKSGHAKKFGVVGDKVLKKK